MARHKAVKTAREEVADVADWARRMRFERIEAALRRAPAVLDETPGRSITCPRCGLRSYNRNDIENKYCGNCREFHEEMEAKRD